jgi:hypothetical protein
MGRPPGPPELVRKNRVVLLVTDEELLKLQRLSDDARRPLGTVAYELFSRALKRVT